MTEVAAGTPTTGVAPLAVLGGHPDDEPADRVHAPWAARSATAAAGVWPRDQLSMPAEEGLGRDQGVPVTAYPSPEARGLCGQAPALGVGDPETARTERLSADAILFLERVNDVTRLLVDPARDGHDEALQHVGNRRHTGRASQRLSAVTNVATRRASSVESARRTASIGFLDSTGLAYTLANIWQTLGITFRYMARHNEVLQPSPSSDTCQAVPNPGLRSPRVLSLKKVKQSGAPVACSPPL